MSDLAGTASPDRRRHTAVLRKVRSLTTGNWIRCNWFDCDKDGYENFKSVLHDHARGIPCSSPLASHINYVFCSERHADYYSNSVANMWNLPAGKKH